MSTVAYVGQRFFQASILVKGRDVDDHVGTRCATRAEAEADAVHARTPVSAWLVGHSHGQPHTHLIGGRHEIAAVAGEIAATHRDGYTASQMSSA